ncbi:MAG: hypothetical protein WDW36_002154 [Sanguina aurantia]
MLGPAVGMGGSWIQSGVRQLAPGRGSVALCLQHERCGHQSREAHGPGPVRCPPSLKRCASNQSERHRPAQRSGATNACAGIRSATPADPWEPARCGLRMNGCQDEAPPTPGCPNPCRGSGRLEVRLLPSMALVFASHSLRSGAVLLCNSASAPLAAAAAKSAAAQVLAAQLQDPVVEIRMESFMGSSSGSGSSRVPDCASPVLLALTSSGHLLAYRAFSPASSSPAPPQHQDPGPRLAPRSDLAWRRLQHLDWMIHRDPALVPGIVPSPGTPPPLLLPRMSRFNCLASINPVTSALGAHRYCGVFVSGARPAWLVATRGSLILHRASESSPVAAMTPFHNASCPHGFITACTAGQLHICQLPHRARMDTPWVTQRVSLKVSRTETSSPHRIAYIKDAGLVAVLACRSVPSRPRLPLGKGSDPHAAAAYAAAAAAAQLLGKEEGWEVLLLDPCSLAILWKSVLLQAGERGTCLRAVHLKDTSTGNTAAFLAVGTAFPLGEDYPCGGRILLYDIAKKGPGAGGAHSQRWAGRLVHSREVAGPVTSVQDFKSQLLVSTGSKVEMMSWGDSGPSNAAAPSSLTVRGEGALTKTAFFDAPPAGIVSSSAPHSKRTSLCADGAPLCQEDSKVLSEMGKEFDSHDAVATGIVVDDRKLLFVYADAGGALRQRQYVMNHSETYKGERLLPDGALHMGRMASPMVSIKMATTDSKNRHALLFGTTDGSIVSLAPLSDPAAGLRLRALQQLMPHCEAQPAGLNPRAFRRRHIKTCRALGGGERYCRPQAEGSNLVDGDLLWRYGQLDVSLQARLARDAAVAANGEALLSDMQRLALAARFT